MNQNDVYDRWVERQRAAAVPAGFADRVMACVEAPPPGRLARWWQIPIVRAAAWVTAISVLALRVLLAGAIFFWN